MPCEPTLFEAIPIFSLLDAEERAVLAQHVEFRRFTARQRIYRVGDPGGRAYLVISGQVNVIVIDADHQEVVIDSPGPGQMFGLASMLSDSPHETSAIAQEETTAIEVDRTDLAELVQRKPMAGLDLLTMLAPHFRAAQGLVRARAARNPNEVIEERLTVGDRLADAVARFGGSWAFIIMFSMVVALYSGLNAALAQRAWDPYPFILLNLFLSMLAAFQAPVIMMSQNRQDTKDRLRSELDFEVNRRAESEIQGIARKLNMLDDKVDDITELLRNSTSKCS